MVENNKLLTPYDINLSQLDLIWSDGSAIDLRFVMIEMNIYEDIFTNTMSGNIVVSDSKNMFGKIPIQGNEYISIVFDKPGLEYPFKKTFRVYNIGGINNTATNLQIRINFTSEELLLSKSMAFSKVYNNMFISNMVKDIGRNLLKIDIKKFPDSQIEETNGLMDITIPYYNGFQAINWLASRATSRHIGGTYFFYENRDGYWFQSIQNLIKSGKSIATYNYNVKNVDTSRGDPNFTFYDISKYQIVKTPDSLESTMKGRYSGKLLTLDLIRQRFESKNLDGSKLYDDSNKLSSGKSFGNFNDKFGNQITNTFSNYVKFYPTNNGQNEAQYINGKQEIRKTNIENWMIERNAQILQLLGIRLKLIIPGNNFIKVGDIIEVNIPSIEPQLGKDSNEKYRKLDPYLSGNYIITAIRHRITPERYESVVEICRDTLKKSLPSSDNFNPTLRNI